MIVEVPAESLLYIRYLLCFINLISHLIFMTIPRSRYYSFPFPPMKKKHYDHYQRNSENLRPLMYPKMKCSNCSALVPFFHENSIYVSSYTHTHTTLTFVSLALTSLTAAHNFCYLLLLLM